MPRSRRRRRRPRHRRTGPRRPAGGHGPEEVAAVVAPGALLLGYHDAVHAATVAQLQGLRPGDLDSVVDTRWDPAVTLGVRLVSVVADDLQHAGQASYVRGLLEDGYDGPE